MYIINILHPQICLWRVVALSWAPIEAIYFLKAPNYFKPGTLSFPEQHLRLMVIVSASWFHSIPVCSLLPLSLSHTHTYISNYILLPFRDNPQIHGGGGLVTKSCLTLATPWTIACQTPLSMKFSRREYWSALPFPSPGDLPNPGIKPRSPALQADSSPTELWGKPKTASSPRSVCGG